MTSNEKTYLEQLLNNHTAELTNQFARHVTAISESFDHIIGLIAEGHMTLHQAIQNLAKKTDERFDLVDFKFEVLNTKIDGVAADLKATDARLSQKIDAVAADLKAHRNDTEAHHGVYQVKENS